MDEIGNIDSINPKILTLEEAIMYAHNVKKEGGIVVTTNGCFDILHAGHIRNLQYARSLGDVLIVGVNSDASVQTNKGMLRPLVPAEERAEVLSALACVDSVFIFNDLTPNDWLKKVKPSFHVKGSDRTIDQVIEKDVVEQGGGQVVLFPHTIVHSTTDILKTAEKFAQLRQLYIKYKK